MEKYISKDYHKYLCNCLRPYIDDTYTEGLHNHLPGFKLHDKLVRSYFMSVPHPYHEDVNGIRVCMGFKS